jgi:O-succinylbenzoate synthase
VSGAGLAGVEIVRLRLPLVAPWVTTMGVIDSRDVLLARAVVDGAEGWGECVAQPEPTYSSEYVDGAAAVLDRHLLPRLVDGPPLVGPDGVADRLAPVRGHLMAKATLEAAVLDAWLRVRGRSLAVDLARRAAPPSVAVPATVPAGVVVGITGSVEGLLAEVATRVAEGYRRVKLKIHPGWDVVPVAAVRDRWPTDELALQVDANGAYATRADPAGDLAPLDDLDLLVIEQPLADDDLLGHAALAARLRTRVCLDESLTSVGGVATALALGACSAVNLKAGRVGGPLEAVAIHDLCRRAGVPVWCGGMLETGIGRALNLALASLPGFTLPGDLSAADRFWAEDIVTRPARLTPDGTIAVPDGPGIGVELRADLAAVTVSRRWYRAT